MAINFEAANMAGYNNPKIEVFKATLAGDGQTLAQYPAKAAIMAAVNRGSIPFILLLMTNGNASIPLPLSMIVEEGESALILFLSTSKTNGEYTVLYPQTSDTPVYSFTE